MFLYTDSDVFQIEVSAKTRRGAILHVRERFNIVGRIRIKNIVGSDYEYRIDNTTFCFSLKQI